MDAGVRTQVLNWMNKGTTKSLSALCMNKGQRESARSCLGSETHQGSYESIHQVPGAEVKTIQRLLICRVLWTQGQCSAGCSVTHTEAPGTGAGEGGCHKGAFQPWQGRLDQASQGRHNGVSTQKRRQLQHPIPEATAGGPLGAS